MEVSNLSSSEDNEHKDQIHIPPPPQERSIVWYKHPKSWIAIACLICIPIPIVGVVIMWIIAPWSIVVKRILATTFIVIPLVVLLSVYVLVSRAADLPGGAIDQAADAKRISDIDLLARSAQVYCVEKQMCPAQLDELTQKDFSMQLGKIPTDSTTGNPYGYERIGLNNCRITSTLSTGTEYAKTCVQ
jgi:hypothetical protein